MEQIILDTSVFNRIEKLDEAEQERLLQLLDGTARRVRLTWETIKEVVSVAGTGKGSRLPRRCRLLHTLLNLPPFQPFPQVVRSELAGDSIYFSKGDHDSLRKVLEKLAGGHAPNSTLRELHLVLGAEKKGHRDGYRKLQEPIQKRMHGQPSLERDTPFDEFLARYWTHWRPRLDTLIDASPNTAPLSAALESPPQYPHSHAFLVTHAALLYRYMVQNRHVDPGDVYDAAGVVGLAGMDSLITEDRELCKVGALVWGESKRIISFEVWRPSLGVTGTPPTPSSPSPRTHQRTRSPHP